MQNGDGHATWPGHTTDGGKSFVEWGPRIDETPDKNTYGGWSNETVKSYREMSNEMIFGVE